MKLYYWKGVEPFKNFGDELNPIIWSRLLSNLLDDDDRSLFLGIGTILNNKIPSGPTKIVLGSGVGYGEKPLIDEKWKFYSLRGPLTANMLGLPESLVVTDPAILIKNCGFSFIEKKKIKFGYMPHWLNAFSKWKHVCAEIDFLYIDPLNPVMDILSSINQVDCLICEAMHGAIVADCFRIPWIPVYDVGNRDYSAFKWKDWCGSMDVTYKPYGINHLPNRYEEKWKVPKTVLQKAASQLKEIASMKPVLSQTSILSEKYESYNTIIERLKRDLANV
jgi:succinoglycan biosynthesis protein ExoV